MNDKLKAIADAADVIVNGYSFKREDNKVSVVNLNRPDHVATLSVSGEILDTRMDDIENEIVRTYLQRNLKYMGKA